ncbi:M48 family metalloprotease [Spirosoma sp. HMF4905]|uniref:M48 family metalloprotease n=1 Tax=Spirosoma arboris TaxID=2682092 RepID=A0A7K1SHB3_9BACT|nr:M56 family metallopeptidase [Spirosoma arboris]MVM33108.1 M48 family metalloprotease [Spirosoma arboris]
MELLHTSLPSWHYLIQALCRTLVHSLWQGLLLAALTGIVAVLTRKSSATIRYQLFAFLFFLFVVGSGFTFYLQFGHPGPVKTPLPRVADPETTSRFSTYLPVDFQQVANATAINWLMDSVAANAVLIVAIWFIIFSARCVQAMASLGHIQRIRHYKTHKPAESWPDKLQELAQKIGLRQTILLLESELVNVPTVVGLLKPVILLPIGLLAHLPIHELEAILLHELAHIKRKDYLVNLMQSFAESVFFFNPAVWWVSALIREEREHCCDDMAIGISGNKTSFINALVAFQEYNLTRQSYAMRLSSKRNHLLERIKRIVYTNNQPLNAMEKIFVTSSIAITVLVTVAFVPSSYQQKIQENYATILSGNQVVSWKHPTTQPDTLPKKKSAEYVDLDKRGTGTYSITKDGKRYEFIEKKGVISSLQINGKQIPDDQIATYKAEIDTILKDIKEAQRVAEIDRKQAEKARDQAELARRQAEKSKQAAEQGQVLVRQAKEMAELVRLKAELNAEDQLLRAKMESFRSAKDAEQAYNKTELAQLQRQLDKLQQEAFVRGRAQQDKMRAESVAQLAELRGRAEQMKQMAEDSRSQAMIAKLRAEEAQDLAQLAKKHAELARGKAEEAKIYFEKTTAGVIDDLIQEGIISDKNGLSFKLSNDELEVNGVKQPDSVHQKLKAKYVHEAGLEIIYNHNGRTGISKMAK